MTRPRRSKATATSLTDLQWAYLNDAVPADQPSSWRLYELQADAALGTNEPVTTKLWAEFRNEVLATWIEDHPGTRPSLWWRFDAPRAPRGTYDGWWFDGEVCDGRRRLGGTGTASHDELALVPEFDCGLPLRWITTTDVVTFNLACPTVDPDDPPLFESQAAYLDRHGLLSDAERKRLPADAFEPEAVRGHDDPQT